MELTTLGEVLFSKLCKDVNNIHIYFSWCQEEYGIPIGLLTESSIEVCNKDVKKANR